MLSGISNSTENALITYLFMVIILRVVGRNTKIKDDNNAVIAIGG
jgi:hypothetical protein